MTRLPVSEARDLGPILAIAAAIIASIAIIAGFVIVGGPGNARDERLDDKTMYRISMIVDAVQCAFNTTGIAPITYENARKTQSSEPDLGAGPVFCDGYGNSGDFEVSEGENPPAFGGISFSVIGAAHVKVCGNFRTNKDNPTLEAAGVYGGAGAYPQLFEPRPAGVHCFDLNLVKRGPVQQDAF